MFFLKSQRDEIIIEIKTSYNNELQRSDIIEPVIFN